MNKDNFDERNKLDKILNWFLYALIITILGLTTALILAEKKDNESLSEFAVNFPKRLYYILYYHIDFGSYCSKETDPNFSKINKLNYNLYYLNSYYNHLESKGFLNKDLIWNIDLVNLKDDSILHRWKLHNKDISSSIKLSGKFSKNYIHNADLHPDKSISFNTDLISFKLDKNSNIVWKSKINTHHCSSKLNDSIKWGCNNINYYINNINSNNNYNDNSIFKINTYNGKILWKKTIADILSENNMNYVLHGYSNYQLFIKKPIEAEPIHLNDIEVARKNTKYWKKGDLFLSIRNRSMIVLYRPSTQRIIKVIQGDFLQQHDVDIISDKEICIFNNNRSSIGDFTRNVHQMKLPVKDSLIDRISKLTTYDFETDTFCNVYEKGIKENNIYACIQGSYQFLSNGDVMISNQNKGKHYVLSKNETLYRDYCSPKIDEYIRMGPWSRVYEQHQIGQYGF